MSNRLVRLRQKYLPEGIQALAWTVHEGAIIVYANLALGAYQRTKAVRVALKAANVHNRFLGLWLWPLIFLRPTWKKHKQQTLAKAAVIGAVFAALALGLTSLFVSGGYKPSHASSGTVPNLGMPTLPVNPTRPGHHSASPVHTPGPLPSMSPTIRQRVAPPIPAPVPRATQSPSPTVTIPPPIPSPTITPQPPPKPSCHTFTAPSGHRHISCHGRARGIDSGHAGGGHGHRHGRGRY